MDREKINLDELSLDEIEELQKKLQERKSQEIKKSKGKKPFYVNKFGLVILVISIAIAVVAYFYNPVVSIVCIMVGIILSFSKPAYHSYDNDIEDDK